MNAPIGIHYDVPFEEYQAIEAISASQLSALKRSPAHFRAALEATRKETSALVFGKALHYLILEPDKFAENVILGPDVKTRDNATYRNWLLENPGKTIMLASEWEPLFDINEAIVKNKTAWSLLQNTKREVSIVWRCRTTGELCKGRVDAWNPELKLLLDVKTCENASRFSFQKAISDYAYHRKAAWYEWGMYELGNPTDLFAFIAVEKEKPYGVKCYTLDAHDIRLAKYENEELLKKYACCKQLDTWPCYEDCPEDLGVPEWVRKDLEKQYGEKLNEELSGTFASPTNGSAQTQESVGVV